MIRRLLVVAALVLLGACNMVVTKEPVFSPADARGAPPMRPGVWAGEPGANCQLDEGKPLADWPSCANGFVVLDDHTIGDFTDQGGKHVWSTTDVVLAAGEPRVLQVHATSDDPLMPSAYLYAGFEPAKLDGAGRIVAGRAWFVICGPPPPPTKAPGPGGADTQQQRVGTLHPFAGLTMDKDGVNCTPDSPAALQGAARQSRELTAPKDVSGSHWVRDGDK